MRLTKIDSLERAELGPYRTMRRPIEHRSAGIFVAEGEKVVRRLVESNLEIVSILLTPEWLNRCSSILAERKIEESVFVAEKSLLEHIVGYGLHQGIMAIGKVPEPVDAFNALASFKKPRLLVATDGIANSENMGVIVRNCAAFGAQLLIAGETSCDPYLRRSVRNSMGTIFSLPVSKVEKLYKTLEKLQSELFIRFVAADPKSGSIEVAQADLAGDVCIVFGSEGEGISREILEHCDIRIKIPMYHDVDSINVASSVAVILYEVAGRRAASSSQSQVD